ncbi:hypothetical protein [Campylobacter sp. CCS1377]|uniref:Uncharacterized protein n=1 Tax=Campylobacter sp. CCS1377 TaxID=3158229 RepID=A0AAU7E5K0_9BACT
MIEDLTMQNSLTFAKEIQSLGVAGISFLMFLIMLFISYKLFKSKMLECANDKEKILEVLRKIDDDIEKMRDDIRDLK